MSGINKFWMPASLLIVITMIVCYVAFGAEKPIGTGTAAMRWEYKILEAGSRFYANKDLEILINGLGQDGWELAAVAAVDDRNTKLYFKRLAQ